MNKDRKSPGRRKPVSEYISGAGDQKASESGTNKVAPAPKQPHRGLAVAIGIPAAVAILGIIAVVIWFGATGQSNDVSPQVPQGVQNAQAAPATSQTQSPTPAQAPESSGQTQSAQQASETPPQSRSGTGSSSQPSSPAPTASSNTMPSGSWPQFRGPNLNAKISVNASLSTDWQNNPPKKLWSVKLGEGYAGPAVRDGKVYVLDYDQNQRADVLRCFSLANGNKLWSQSYSVMIKRNHGFSRTVPTLSGKYVVTLGPKCDVMCADANSGEVYWTMDLVEKYKSKVPSWYAGQCPLVEGNQVILAPGGTKMMVAVDIASGNVIWEAPNPMGWDMTHCSIRPMTINGQKMYVYPASGGVVGVAPGGEILWQTNKWRVSTANIPTPVPVSDGRIFLCGGYNAGSMMMKLTGSGSNMSPQVDWTVDARTFGSHQHTPILYKDHLYGVLQSKELACLDLQGNQKWTSGRTNRFGLGPYIMANDYMYVLAESGKLVLLNPTPQGYDEITSAKVLDAPGAQAWGPLAMVEGILLARDLETMVCLDVRAQ
ncbi:MAG: PQQ-binding-like beta-propeller repeat protein [Armatimonadota bacterium]